MFDASQLQRNLCSYKSGGTITHGLFRVGGIGLQASHESELCDVLDGSAEPEGWCVPLTGTTESVAHSH